MHQSGTAVITKYALSHASMQRMVDQIQWAPQGGTLSNFQLAHIQSSKIDVPGNQEELLDCAHVHGSLQAEGEEKSSKNATASSTQVPSSHIPNRAPVCVHHVL